MLKDMYIWGPSKGMKEDWGEYSYVHSESADRSSPFPDAYT